MNAPHEQALSILVVDDHPTNRLVIASVLRKHGFLALEAADGAEALDVIRAARPALVISDILMPSVDGFELVKRLRADPVIGDTRVILCTATYREQEAEVLARIGGVSRVLAKPCDPVVMIKAIRDALQHAPITTPPDMDHVYDREHMRIMTDKLSTQEAALRHAQRLARLAHIISLPDGTFESWSDTLPELLGRDADAIPRNTRDWLTLIHPDHRENFRNKALAAARYGLRAEVEYPFARPDGGWIVLAQVMDPLPTSSTAVDQMRWFSTLQDVSAQKRAEDEVRLLNTDLERRVRERTAALESAMKELESFDYSISHDLRAPINRIRGFTGALEQDHAFDLKEEGRDLLRRVAAAGEHMEQLVNDLFALSTVSRGELRIAHVDLSAMAGVVIGVLVKTYPDRRVEAVVEPGLTARADPGLVRIILENLIGNAWKFTGRREDARVEVGRDPGATPDTFFVRDNGAGFDPAKAERLFQPFQRLHAKRDFDGTGIGLATVSRVVGRHGGRVWAEGAPDAGATIRFTLSG